MQNNKLMVFGYVRVSTENQIENYSIEEQIERIKAYCKAKDWLLLKLYTDGGYSGGNTDRPALRQMLQAIKTNKVNAVVVYKLDRLSRSQKDTLTLIEDEFIANNVDFISINENFDTSTPFGRAMIGILSVFAQLEKDQITERFTMGRIGRSKAGFYHGGSIIPYGYNYAEGKLVVDEYKAIQVREIFSLFLAGNSINSIWHTMETKYGGKWSATKVRLILLNSIYIGKVKFAGVEYAGIHEPIISKETFTSAGALLTSADRENYKTTSQKTPFRAEYLLSSLIYCAQCGARYSGNHGYYKCYSRAKSCKKFIKDPDCKNDNWIIEELDKEAVTCIRQLSSDQPLLTSVLNSSTKTENKVDKKAVTAKIKESDNQMNRLIDLYQVGSIPLETLTTRINQLNLEKTILQKQLEENPDDMAARRESFIENIKCFVENFDTAPLETKRLLISSLVEAVWVDGGTVNIKWRI